MELQTSEIAAVEYETTHTYNPPLLNNSTFYSREHAHGNSLSEMVQGPNYSTLMGVLIAF